MSVASAGYKSTVYTSGTSTAMADEAMTQRGATQVFYTGDAAKNVWDPNTLIVVEDNGAVVDPDDYSVDHLMGRVVFNDGYVQSGPITVTGAYLVRVKLATARASTFNMMRVLPDSSVLDQDHVTRISGRRDCAGTVEALQDGSYDHGSGSTPLIDTIDGGEVVLIERKARPDHPRVARAWALFEGVDTTSDLEDLTTASLGWVGTLPGSATQSHSYGDPTS